MSHIRGIIWSRANLRHALRFGCCGVLSLMLTASLTPLRAANFGSVVPVVGQAVDLLYDAQRRLVYLANSTNNQVDIYSADVQAIIGNIPVGTQPTSLTISPDGSTLYV